MLSITMFVEDSAHQVVITALISRIAKEAGIDFAMRTGSARGGRPRVAAEFKQYLRDLQLMSSALPDCIIVATDANCVGLVERRKEFSAIEPGCRMVLAIPDPHVERWLLLDSAAFKRVFGRGCDAPDLKCERDRYKQQLRRAIRAAGIDPSLGGIEYAADIIDEINIGRVSQFDPSFDRFVSDFRAVLKDQ